MREQPWPEAPFALDVYAHDKKRLPLKAKFFDGELIEEAHELGKDIWHGRPHQIYDSTDRLLGTLHSINGLDGKMRVRWHPEHPDYDVDRDFSNVLEANPMEGEAEELLDLLLTVLDAQKAYKAKKKEVPLYTAQWSPEDYYRQALHERNVAANRLSDLLRVLHWQFAEEGDPR